LGASEAHQHYTPERSQGSHQYLNYKQMMEGLQYGCSAYLNSTRFNSHANVGLIKPGCGGTVLMGSRVSEGLSSFSPDPKTSFDVPYLDYGENENRAGSRMLDKTTANNYFLFRERGILYRLALTKYVKSHNIAHIEGQELDEAIVNEVKS
jgi:hypothetical protein